MVDGGGGASDLLVIFGITGDLARKMTFRALYRLERHQLLDCPILGVASDDMSVGQLVKWARESIGRTEKIDDAVFDRLAGRLSYLHGDVTDSQLYDSLAELIGSACRPLYYLEMPPALFAPIVENLANVRLLERARVAVEKPFGHDLASALELNARLRAVLGEDQILRVDHFLGKQPVVELEYLRFANQALAELWDRNSISEIHITMAEDFGVEDRGKFYDAVGALRDVVQNHLLQVLALVTMEPPVGSSADDLNDKKAEVFRAMAPLDPDRCVRGQYLGYTEVAGVASDSATETYVARSTTGAGPGCRSSCGPEKSCPRRSPKYGYFYAEFRHWPFCPTADRPSPTRLCCVSTPIRVCDCRFRPTPTTRGEISTWTPRSRWTSVNRYDPMSGCCMPDWSAITSCSPARTASSRRGGSCSRCSTTRVKSIGTIAVPGVRKPRSRCCAVTAVGSRRGCPAARTHEFKETKRRCN
ncbi:glucose-6-phosphate 1-dehydrogenase [Mycobacterium tuberculosis]|nr:glucose-6-phosphate 1-dehydrogenase [Mycobacterium tuberculosis]CNJ62158.1 glucose-6-phosphate 1-dehydrogenase [Mycobacterium tuberculosis]